MGKPSVEEPLDRQIAAAIIAVSGDQA